jgi:hypothetical protein
MYSRERKKARRNRNGEKTHKGKQFVNILKLNIKESLEKVEFS